MESEYGWVCGTCGMANPPDVVACDQCRKMRDQADETMVGSPTEDGDGDGGATATAETTVAAPETWGRPKRSVERPMGPGRILVVYQSADTGAEVDPVDIFRDVAEDGARRATLGQQALSLAVMPLRHAQGFMGRAGSGFETKNAVAVLYETPDAPR